MPPESAAGHARSNPARPNRSKRAAAWARAAPRSTPATSAPSVAFAITRRHGISRSCCGWYATSPGFPFARTPSTAATPRVGTTNPAIMRRSVDLPQPLGPISATSSPAATSRSMAAIASTATGPP
jgi:hypothetical protein